MQADRVELAFVIIFLTVVLAAFLPIVGVFTAPFAVAVIFVTIFYPVYNWFFLHLRNNRVVSSLLTCILFLIILLIPTYVLIQMVISELVEFVKLIQPLIQGMINKGSESRIGKWFLQTPFAEILKINQINWSSVLRIIYSAAANVTGHIIQRTSAGALGLVFNIIIILFTMFYLFMDSKQLSSKLLFLMPIRQEYKKEIITRFKNVARATIIGTLTVGIIQGFVGAFSLYIFGIENWILWGFVMLVIAIIPIIGPPIVMIPAGIYQIIAGNVWQGVGILLSSFIVVSAIDYFLRPRIVGRRAHVHDLLIFFSTLGGISVFGLWGVFIGPAVSALFVAAINIFSNRFESILKYFEKRT